MAENSTDTTLDPKVPFRRSRSPCSWRYSAAEGIHGPVAGEAGCVLFPGPNEAVLRGRRGDRSRPFDRPHLYGFVSHEFGEEAFKVERLGDSPVAGPEVKAERGA